MRREAVDLMAKNQQHTGQRENRAYLVRSMQSALYHLSLPKLPWRRLSCASKTISCYWRAGKQIPLLSNACFQPLTGLKAKVPIEKKVQIAGKTVSVLRDTGYSGVVVKKEFVSNEQFTGNFNCMLLIDNTVRKFPIARITVNSLR